ncbi:hypothetical protein NC651_002344 [Populus alba x Populus x berolinensis]|nr:hypothetical protein NC651_002344 [Populus alba x Populus x berolinensis]
MGTVRKLNQTRLVRRQARYLLMWMRHGGEAAEYSGKGGGGENQNESSSLKIVFCKGEKGTFESTSATETLLLISIPANRTAGIGSNSPAPRSSRRVLKNSISI